MLSEASRHSAASFFSSAKCSAGSSCNGGMHIRPDDGKLEAIPAVGDETGHILGRDARLLRFFAGIDLDEQSRRPSGAAFVDLSSQRIGEARPVDRLDHVEQVERVAHLVGLQGPDQVQLDIRKPLPQRRPLRLGLLNAVLAEQAMARLEHGKNMPFVMALGHRDQLCLRRRSDGRRPGRSDAGQHRGEILRRDFAIGSGRARSRHGICAAARKTSKSGAALSTPEAGATICPRSS